MNEILRIIKERRSVRDFLEKQIPERELALILEAGSYAPSAHNQQPWHFTVVQNKVFLEEINKKGKQHHGRLRQ